MGFGFQFGLPTCRKGWRRSLDIALFVDMRSGEEMSVYRRRGKRSSDLVAVLAAFAVCVACDDCCGACGAAPDGQSRVFPSSASRLSGQTLRAAEVSHHELSA